jgi:Pvc16 N-terminal domain
VPDFAVIADVSLTLENVLTSALSVLAPAPLARVHDLQDPIALAPPTLTIFLFDALEDASARNRPRVRGVALPNSITSTKPPMALLLRYLLTPWSPDRLTDQQILGRAMQALYDDAILSGPQLAGGLAGSDQALKITLTPLSLEERTRVWNAVQKPYRLSVAYEVRVINIDSEVVDSLHPVANRDLSYAEGAGNL